MDRKINSMKGKRMNERSYKTIDKKRKKKKEVLMIFTCHIYTCNRSNDKNNTE
jgi:hypothetical protein